MTNFCDVDSIIMKDIRRSFRIWHKVNIVKLHVLNPLQSMKKTQSLSH